MKSIIAAALAVTMLAGCAQQGAQRGYYDESGVYHPSQAAQNSDNLATAGAVAAGVGIAGALAVGVTALHKANKANKDNDHNDGHNKDGWKREEWKRQQEQQRRYQERRNAANDDYQHRPHGQHHGHAPQW